MLTLIKNAQVFAPEAMGTQDILIAGHQIAAIEANINITLSGADIAVIDAQQAIVTPGFVDPLAHITGGGGEGGFHTRTPEMKLTDASLFGVTTLVAGLGTDATTRTLPDLLAKAHALEHEGLTVYCYTGSYEYPVRTVTGSVRDDLILIDKFIGIGELAIADHRGSHPSPHELARVASEARVGGMLAGKRGIVFLHVGDDKTQLQLIRETCANYPVPVTQFYPTHMNRSTELLRHGYDLAKQGMVLDLTASTTPELLAQGELSAAEALAIALEDGIAASQISISSDGNASLPDFNSHGELIGLQVGRVGSIHEMLVSAVTRYQVPLTQAVQAVSSNAARYLGLKQKGALRSGLDADLVMLNPDSLAVEAVWSRGRQLVANGNAIVQGTFTS